MEDISVKVKQNCCFLPKLAFRYLGVSVNANEPLVYKFYSWFVLSIASTYPLNNVFLLLQNLDNFDIIVNSLFNAIGGLAAFLKVVVILFNRKRVGNLLNKLDSIQEKRNVEKWGQTEAFRTNKLTFVCVAILEVSLLCFFVGTIVGRIVNDDFRKWSLPISDVSFINRTYSPNYEIAWVYQCIAVGVLAPSFCISDFLIAGVIADVCIQLRILQHRIKNAVNHQNNTNETWLGLHVTLKQIVVHHTSLIDLINQTEDVFNALVFLDVMGNSCMICFSVYYASVLPLGDFKALQVYLEVSAITISLFFTCFWGTEISLESKRVADACYEANFVGTDVRFQKGLQLVIMRSQKAMSITVGKFTALSNTVFVSIIKSSYTYFMVLRKTNEDQINSDSI